MIDHLLTSDVREKIDTCAALLASCMPACLIGDMGSGKTSVLKRAASHLAQRGYTVTVFTTHHDYPDWVNVPGVSQVVTEEGWGQVALPAPANDLETALTPGRPAYILDDLPTEQFIAHLPEFYTPDIVDLPIIVGSFDKKLAQTHWWRVCLQIGVGL